MAENHPFHHENTKVTKVPEERVRIFLPPSRISWLRDDPRLDVAHFWSLETDERGTGPGCPRFGSGPAGSGALSREREMRGLAA